jgi:hypothetical protein
MTRRIVFLRSTASYTNYFYYKALQKLNIDLIDFPFDPHKPQTEIEFPEADLLLLVDCGLPVDFPNLKRYSCPKGYISIDSCHKLNIHKAYCDKYNFDYIWVAQKHVAKEFGPNAMWLPLAADEDIHVYKPDKAKNDIFWKRILHRNRYDIGMCAAPYKHRHRFERLFRKAGLSTNFHFRKNFGEEATREIARCIVGFNVGAGYTSEKGMDINMRVFETMANGQAMLQTNTYDDLGYEDLFEEGQHYIAYKSEEEAVEKAVYYAKHPDEAAKIAREGQHHILANHTYVHRCNKLLSIFN